MLRASALFYSFLLLLFFLLLLLLFFFFFFFFFVVVVVASKLPAGGLWWICTFSAAHEVDDFRCVARQDHRQPSASPGVSLGERI